MTRLSLAAFAGASAAALVAWHFGGRTGAGVWTGFLLGAGVSGLGVLYHQHTLLHHPERIMNAVVASFLGKMVFLLMGTLAFRYVEAAAARVDWKSFLVTFAASVALVLPLGTLDAVRVAKRRLTDSLDPKGTH